MSKDMKDSGVEWIGMIPNTWEVKPLKQVLIERKENNNPIKSDFILSLTMDRGVIPYSEKGISGGNKAKEDITAYKLAYPNDIVLNSMNVVAGSVGLSKYFGCVSPVYYMLYPRNEYYKVEYFNNVFQSSVFQRSLFGLGNGIMFREMQDGRMNTIRLRIPINKLNTVLLPVPTTEEQQKISDFLDERVSEIDKIIAQTNESIEEYKKFKQSIITETVTKGLNPDEEMKDSEVDYIGQIPKDWEIKKMKYVTTLGPKCNVNNFANDTIVTFTPMECVKNGNFENRETTYGNYNNSYNSFENEDIIIAKVTPCFENGNIAIAKKLYNGYGFGSSELFVLRCTNVTNEFMFYYLQNINFMNRAISTMTGTGGLKRVSSDFMKYNKLAIPPINEQKRIVQFLDKKSFEIETIITKKQQLLTDLESYKKSLIYECVTGKREVS